MNATTQRPPLPGPDPLLAATVDDNPSVPLVHAMSAGTPTASITNAETEYLSVKWTTSKAGDTYGYNRVTLRDESGHKYVVIGAVGYDMTGTVFAEWLTDTHQDELRAIAGRAHHTYVDGRPIANASGMYGMTAYVNSTGEVLHVYLDGACDLESVRRIAEALGVSARSTHDRKGNTTGFVVTVSK